MRHMCPTEVEESGKRWSAVGLNECFRLSKYVAGDVFKPHVDACFKKSERVKSMFTVNLYLNGADEFSGGSTRFYSKDYASASSVEYSVTPVAGVALIFRQPYGASYVHDGELVSAGEKYLLRSDIMYTMID